MGNKTQAVLDQAMELPANERAQLAERILESLERPEPAIDALWAREAEDRMTAFKEGRISAVSEEEAFA